MSAPNTIVGLGEILWDVFPNGPRFGGAPANFACTAAAMGRSRWTIAMASSVGPDELGDAAIAALQGKHVNTDFVQRASQPTGQVLVQLDGEGHASYEFAKDTAWDNLQSSDEWDRLANQTRAVCFGTLGQRGDQSREVIQRFVEKTPATSLRIFDVNLRPPFFEEPNILQSLKFANVLKLNDDELPIVGTMARLSGSSVALMQQLRKTFDLKCVALTRGSDGAILVGPDDVHEQPGQPTKVVDTVGAGDAFTATLALGLLEGHELETINRRACAVATYVCSQSGATPALPEKLLQQ